jgi:limonene-1,2-epoxide hydrolase
MTGIDHYERKRVKVRREEEVVRAMLESWAEGIEPVKKTWAEHCTQDIVWWNSARGAVEGMDNCLAAIDAIDQLVGGFAYIKVPVRNLVAVEGLVFVERSDDLYRGDDSLIAAVPVTGVIAFRGDKVESWRDYCDDWLREHRPEDAAKAVV